MGLNARIGLFGGAFDPPHIAHVALAHAAIDQLALDRLHVIPTGTAWHKARGLSDGAHRLAMARLAFEDLPQTVVDDRELRRNGPSYTLDTLHELQAESPGCNWFVMLGGDQARVLTTWRGWQQLVQDASVVIAERRDSTLTSGTFEAEIGLAEPFRRLAFTPMDVSATAIRARVAAGLPVNPLVRPAVARYIDQHHLYQTA